MISNESLILQEQGRDILQRSQFCPCHEGVYDSSSSRVKHMPHHCKEKGIIIIIMSKTPERDCYLKRQQQQ